jgi:hypothetical protein
VEQTEDLAFLPSIQRATSSMLRPEAAAANR